MLKLVSDRRLQFSLISVGVDHDAQDAMGTGHVNRQRGHASTLWRHVPGSTYTMPSLASIIATRRRNVAER